MGFIVEELLGDGSAVPLGEPVHDILVAKIVASRRALRTGRLTVVRDLESGSEVARYQSNARSGPHLRAVNDGYDRLQRLSEVPKMAKSG